MQRARALEQALDHAEHVIESAQQRPPKRKYSSSGKPSLHEKLYDIYVEECEKEPEVTEELKSNVNLLEKLVRRESLPCLVVNLYPGNEGYSLMLKGKNGSYSESIQLPYEERELLEYLDAEELPPALVDLLEKSPVNFFHRGCVIAEIRDYRQSSGMEPPGYQSRHILLRPTMQTLVCDVQAITSDNQNWTQEDKLLLESQLILATAEPLCLDPSVSVACTENRLLYNKQKMNTLPMKRSFKRYSMPSLNRQQELSQCPPPPELTVLTSCKNIRENKTGDHYGLKFAKAGNFVDMWKQKPCDLAIPSEVDVEKYTKEINSVRYDDLQTTLWPTHEVQDGSVSEYEEGSQSQATKLTFMQSLNDPLISGKRRSRKKVRCEKQMPPLDTSKDDHSNSFVTGTKNDTGRVVIQSEELVQKNAKCPVQLSHSSSASASLGQPSPGREPEQPKTGSDQSSVLGKGAKHLPPTIKLSVSSGKSSSGNSLTSQQASISHKCPPSDSLIKSPKISEKSSVEVGQVITLPATTQSTAGSSKNTQVSAKSSGLHITKVVCPDQGGQASRRGSKPMQHSTTRAIAPARIKPSQMPRVIKPGPLAEGIELGHQPIGIQANPLPGGINRGHQSTGVKPTTLSGGIKLGHQPKWIKPGPPPGEIKLGRKPIGIRPRPLPGGVKLEHQPAEINPSLLPGGINLGQQPTENKPIHLPAGAQRPNVLPSIPPAPSQGGVQLIFKNASSLGPLTLFQIPPGSLILNTQQQAQQQPQQLQQQWLYQLAPQQQLQQPITSHLQQPVPQVPVQSLINQSTALSAPQATVINLNRMDSFMQPQAVVLSQLGSVHNQAGPILPQQRFQLSSALQPQPQPQPQPMQFAILQHPVAVTTVAAQTAQPHPPSEHTARHSKGKMKRSTPNTH